MSGWTAAWEALYLHGWRVGVFFVDNNSIGNGKKLRDDVLPAMMDWMKRRKYPFDFGAEASIDLAEYRLVQDAPLQWEIRDYVYLRHHHSVVKEGLTMEKKRVYSRASRKTRFKKIHVIHHPGLKVPILLTPEPLPPEPIVLLHKDMPTEFHEQVKKHSWLSWLWGD